MDWSETPAEVARARAERPVSFPGAHGNLFGIFTPPAPEAHLAGLCVVMPGRIRWGTGRIAVKNARALAAEGFACLRFDFHGHGESEGAVSKVGRGDPYGDDVVAAIRYLRQFMGQQRFVLSGYCFDALSSLFALEDEADAIDGLVLLSAPVLVETEVFWDRRYLMRAVVNPTKVRNSLRSLGECARKVVMAVRALRRPVATSAFQLSERFEQHFRALVRSRAGALFLYGERDATYQEFLAAEQYLFAELDPEARQRLEIEVWPGHIHPPTDSQRDQEIFERARSWIAALHPRLGTRQNHLPNSNSTLSVHT